MKYFILITVQFNNEIILESKWTSISDIATMNSTVCALLIKYSSTDEVVKMISKSARYTKINELFEIIFLVLKFDEKFLFLNLLSVHYICHHSAQ